MAEITSEGFRFDRQYLIVKAPKDSSQRLLQHLTIKTTYTLALFHSSINDDWSELTVRFCGNTSQQSQASNAITLPLTPSPLAGVQSRTYDVNIFGTTAAAIDMGEGPASFFTKHLGISTRLLFISGKGRREIPGIAYIPERLTSLTVNTNTGGNLQPQRIRFADAAPFLITSTASEEAARVRLPPSRQAEDVIIRLRPNIHIDVGPNTAAFDEDHWRELVVAGDGKDDPKATIRCVFTTPRCLSLNVDLTTGTRASKDTQLYGLLAKDRRVNSAFPRMLYLPLSCIPQRPC
jgi:uncharacterized protein